MILTGDINFVDTGDRKSTKTVPEEASIHAVVEFIVTGVNKIDVQQLRFKNSGLFGRGIRILSRQFGPDLVHRPSGCVQPSAGLA